ncbi:MAG TPA: HNH endonuclease signature motif containing protein [Gemmatimonadaceae bacterium]|nr:HNH endonuclease signature motif containing protein [Gemmatimonadaceae bacterium]
MTDDSSDSPYRHTHPRSAPKPHKPHKPHPVHKAHGRKASTTKNAKRKPSTSGRRRKRGAGRTEPGASPHTSHPTTRAAQVSTRAWLLRQYGPTCAYCGVQFATRTMTLDHVAPRRGQSAYDRRDNLVLACRPCNIKKRDQSPLAFLLGLRSRAVNLVKFGAHLSEGLLEMARSLIPNHLVPSSGRANIDYSKWGPLPTQSDDDDSPYRR